MEGDSGEERPLDADLAEAERERLALLDAVWAAIQRRAQVLEVVFEAAAPEDALRSVQELLDVEERHAQAVLDVQFRRLTAPARAHLEAERERIRSSLGE
jgi:DNA gyrase/topoisomerase IV subunit A